MSLGNQLDNQKSNPNMDGENNVLERIVANKKLELVERKKIQSLEFLNENLACSNRSFKKALSNDRSDFIFECKKASPSKGLLRETYDLKEILASYKKYASAISVLTDNKYFQGSHEHLKLVTETVSQPVLCKDFFIDEYQIYEARYYGADAILLMLSVLSDQEYRDLAIVANSLDLDVLTEVHDELELNRALTLGAQIIGINNRNLKDLSINLKTTEILLDKLTEQQRNELIFISESGIKDHNDVKRLSNKVDGFLVGSSIMEKKNISHQCKELLFGRIKICGIIDILSAKKAAESGATYAGFIFHPPSPRNIQPCDAREIAEKIEHDALDFVGVFVEQNADEIIQIAKDIPLTIVQLHGDQDLSVIEQIKIALPDIEIWKVLSIDDSVNHQILEEYSAFIDNPNISKILLDTHANNQRGGTGKTFDWNSIDTLSIEKNNIVLAGGLNVKNIEQASNLQTYALDVNSGVESAPGIKDVELISALFEKLRV